MRYGRERSHRERDATQGRRLPYERILIITEGRKTEPNYFREIRVELRLSEVIIKVMNCSTGTTPMQIVDFFESYLRENKTYDAGYCVFDRDEHPGYFEAIDKTKRLNRKMRNDEGRLIQIRAIYSNPCFELWILSHFPERVERHIERNEVFSLVRHCLPGYEKGSNGVFAKTREKLGEAYSHAERMRKLCLDRGTDNPQTLVDELAKKLLSQGKA